MTPRKIETLTQIFSHECIQESFVSLNDCCFDVSRWYRFTGTVDDNHFFPFVVWIKFVPELLVVEKEIGTVGVANLEHTRALNFQHLVDDIIAMLEFFPWQHARPFWQIVFQHSISLYVFEACLSPFQTQQVLSQELHPSRAVLLCSTCQGRFVPGVVVKRMQCTS